MSEKSIQTKTVSKNIAQSNPIKLSETPETKVGFIPTLHPKGVTGHLVKYRKTSAKDWDDLNGSNFKSHALAPMEKVSIKLDTEATATFLSELTKLGKIVEQGIQDGSKDYDVIEKGKSITIDDQNKLPILKKILDGGHSDDFWNLIAQDQPDLANRLVAGHIQHLRAATVAKLKERLTETHSETTGPDSWQSWIFENHWLFGVNYQEPIQKQKINLKGVMPDFLFPRIDGFIDLLEIKLPSHSVIIPDSNHPGSYRWHSDTTKAIGQVVFYLSEIERLRFDIERHISDDLRRNVSMLKPRAYILIGNSEGWSPQQRDGLRRLNGFLHGVEVLTYEELIHRGEAFLVGSNLKVASQIDEEEIPF